MNTRIVRVAIAAICIIAPDAAAQDRLSGNWTGYWTRAGDTMAVTMAVQKDAASGRYAASFDAERLRVSGIPFNDVQVAGCCDVTLTLRGDRTTAVFTGTLNNDSLTGTFSEGTSEGRFAYARAKNTAAAFDERMVTFSNGGVELAGTLLLPREGKGLPAVVFAHGSGGEGRWASRFLAGQLARNGIAALIFDKRGVGSSKGDWRTATLDDLAGDVAAGVARLREEARIDARRIGLHGHSQGGTLAPFIAARSQGIAFIIGSAAAGMPMDSTEIFSILNSVLPNAVTREDSANARAYTSELVDVAYNNAPRERLDELVATLRGRPWFFAPPPADNSYWAFSKVYAQYRPLEWWARVRVPVLLIYGAEDQRVPAAESSARIASTLLRAGNSDVAVRILPGADHTFRLAPGAGGWPLSAPDYVPSLLAWLARR